MNDNEMKQSFQFRSKLSPARRHLAKYMRKNYGLILRKNSHDIYILDENKKGYIKQEFDDIMNLLAIDLGKETICDDDLSTALTFISDRLEPTPNIVRFNNELFDMETMCEIWPKEPIFTLIGTDYNLNNEAKSTILKEFLESSLKKDTPQETQECIKGVFQLVGYLFTSGNKLNVLPMITGISGGGKSVFGNLLTAIFGKDRVADLKLQEIENNTHATSSLANKHLNIINDSDATSISNNSTIKQMTGNDSIQINPKYQQPYVLSKEEVPKSIIICNSIPDFKRLEPALVERILIIEFNVKFRGTIKENPNLLEDILANPEEIEWFIYQSLEAYANMVFDEKDFILRKSGSETKKLINKHQHPINYLLSELIVGCDNPIYDSEDDKPIFTNDLNRAIINLAEKRGLDIQTDKNNRIPPKKLIGAIRNEIEVLGDGYHTKVLYGKRYYPDLRATALYWELLEG